MVDEIKAAQSKPTANISNIAIKEISLDSKKIENFVGDYKLSFGIPLKLINEAGKLTAQVRQQPKQNLLAISATEFSTADSSIKIKFLPPEKGKFIKLTINLNSQQLDGEKIENLTITDDLTKQFVGKYYSEELNTIYTVIAKDSKLLLSHRRGEEPLNIKHDDEFTTGFSAEARRWRSGEYVRIKFLRAAQNRVTGFLLSMPTARNIRFEKSEKF